MRLELSPLLISLAACGACGGNDATPADAPPASCTAARPSSSGEGTYYDADGTGNCGFPADASRMVAAINAADYGTASWCGGCVRVTGPKGDVTVRIVDQCPGCAKGDLDLSREAFAQIADLSAGRVPISWTEVACDVTGPLEFHLKDGSNAHWTAIQVRNHRYPIATLEAQKNGSYAAISRVSYNYFVATSGLGAGPYTLRVTDTRGHVVEEPNIALGDDVERTGTQQLPMCPP